MEFDGTSPWPAEASRLDALEVRRGLPKSQSRRELEALADSRDRDALEASKDETYYDLESVLLPSSVSASRWRRFVQVTGDVLFHPILNFLERNQRTGLGPSPAVPPVAGCFEETLRCLEKASRIDGPIDRSPRKPPPGEGRLGTVGETRRCAPWRCREGSRFGTRAPPQAAPRGRAVGLDGFVLL